MADEQERPEGSHPVSGEPENVNGAEGDEAAGEAGSTEQADPRPFGPDPFLSERRGGRAERSRRRGRRSEERQENH